MTQVDFYILTGGGVEDALKVACRLCEKAQRKTPVYLHCQSLEQAENMGNLLWAYRPEAFLPNALVQDSAQQEAQERIMLGTSSPPDHFHDLIINLSDQIPERFARFERLLEVVPAEHGAREASRKKYKHYKDRGYPLNHHNIDPSG